MYTRVFSYTFYDCDADQYFTIRNEARPFSKLYVPPRRFLWDAERKIRAKKNPVVYMERIHASDRRNTGASFMVAD